MLASSSWRDGCGAAPTAGARAVNIPAPNSANRTLLVRDFPYPAGMPSSAPCATWRWSIPLLCAQVAARPVELRSRTPSCFRTDRVFSNGSRQVDRVTLQVRQFAIAERAFVRRAQDHSGRLPGLECFLPAGRAQAPAVAGLQSCEAEFRHWRGKVVPAPLGEFEKLIRHDGADGVAAEVLGACVAAAVTEKAGEGLHRTLFELPAEDVPRELAAAAPSARLQPHLVLHGAKIGVSLAKHARRWHWISEREAAAELCDRQRV